MPFTNLDPVRFVYDGPKPKPTAEVNVNTLSSNPTVVRVMCALQFERQFSAHDLATKTHTPLHQLSPVLRAMQRSQMIEAGRFFPGSRVTYYRVRKAE